MTDHTPRPASPAEVIGEVASRNLSIYQYWIESRKCATVSPLPTDIVKLLRHHGLNVTAQRMAVMESVSTRPHATADEVVADVRDAIGSVSKQAVYDALGVFSDYGLVRRIQPARSPARFEARVGDNHHHVVCRSCGITADVDCAVGHQPCLDAATDRGFLIDEAEVLYWGLCPECQGAASTQSEQSPPPTERKEQIA